MDSVYKERIRKFKLLPEEPKELAVVSETEDDRMIFGWRVKWRDWVPLANQDACIGIWVAYPPMLQGVSLYSAYPGACGWFWPGAIFDLGRREWQTLPTMLCEKSDLEEFKRQALAKLQDYIWQVGEPPYDPYAAERAEVA